MEISSISRQTCNHRKSSCDRAADGSPISGTTVIPSAVVPSAKPTTTLEPIAPERSWVPPGCGRCGENQDLQALQWSCCSRGRVSVQQLSCCSSFYLFLPLQRAPLASESFFAHIFSATWPQAPTDPQKSGKLSFRPGIWTGSVFQVDFTELACSSSPLLHFRHYHSGKIPSAEGGWIIFIFSRTCLLAWSWLMTWSHNFMFCCELVIRSAVSPVLWTLAVLVLKWLTVWELYLCCISFILRIPVSRNVVCFQCFRHPGGAIKRIDGNLDAVLSCVVTICARPRFLSILGF